MTIDTNAMTAALEAFLENLVAPIVERAVDTRLNQLNSRIDLAMLSTANRTDAINVRVSRAQETLDVHSKGLANLETAIETLGKRVDDHKDEAEGVTDGVLGRITRLERDLEVLTKRIGDDMDNFAAGQDADRTRLDGRIDGAVTQLNDLLGGIGKRIDYGETRLNEAREAIRELQGKVVEMASTNITIIGEIDDLKKNRKTSAVLTDFTQLTVLEPAIDKRLDDILSGAEADEPLWAKFDWFVKQAVQDALPGEYDLDAYAVDKIKEYLDSDLAAAQIADMFETGRLERKLESIINDKFSEQQYMTYEDVRSRIDMELDEFASGDALHDAVTDLIQDKLDGARITLRF